MLEEQSGEGFLTKGPVYLGVGDAFVCMSSSSAVCLFYIKVGIKMRVGRRIGTCPSVWVSIQFPIILFMVNFNPFYKVHFTTSPTHLLFDWTLNLSFSKKKSQKGDEHYGQCFNTFSLVFQVYNPHFLLHVL